MLDMTIVAATSNERDLRILASLSSNLDGSFILVVPIAGKVFGSFMATGASEALNGETHDFRRLLFHE
jgi:hypothetical protein